MGLALAFALRQDVGQSKENFFKKCEGSAITFIICPTLFIFSKPKLSRSRSLVHVENFYSHTLIGKLFCPGPITPNVCV